MGTDALNYAVGGVTYPLTSSTANPLLKDADPALYYLLDYLSSMVTTLVGARIVAQAAAAQAPITSAVAQQLPYDPAPYLTTEQIPFPLIAVYRRKATYDMHSIVWWHRKGEFGVTYVLPPLTAGQAEAMLPLLHAVSDAIGMSIEVGAYPTYTPPGGTAGQSAMSLTGLEEAALESDAYGMFPNAQGLVFPAWTGVFSAWERRMPVTGYDAFGAADNEIDLTSSLDQSNVTNLVQTKTDVPLVTQNFSGTPTITSVTPNTGPTAGGTSITIAGANFFGSAVSLDGVPCTSVVVAANHASITCTTPAHAAGAVTLAVVNGNGATGFLTKAFTYQ